MKNILKIMIIFILLITGVYAEENEESILKYSPVQNYDFNFSVQAVNWKIESQWNIFSDSENLKWYKFVYSHTNKNPAYPEDNSEYIWNNTSTKTHSQYLEAGMYYVRLCAITYNNERFCSKVKQVTIIDTWSKFISQQEIDDYKNKFASTDLEKVVIKKWELSDKIKRKIEKAVGKFITRLEKKWYSDKKIVKVIDKIIIKARSLKVKPKIQPILDYLIVVLEREKM